MDKDNIDKLFEGLKGEFDVAEPKIGHRERFLEKLNQNKGIKPLPQKRTVWWKPLSMAASIAFVCIIGLHVFNTTPSIKEQVVKIAPEASNTEHYFVGLIEEQMQQLNDLKSPETAKLIDDTLAQLNKLETDYALLEKELVNGRDIKIILNAMIINFQTRIDLLKEVLTNVDTINNLKSFHNENRTI